MESFDELSPERIRQIEARWKSDVDAKLDALIRSEREFREKYSAFIDMLIQREADRAAMRKAVMEKTLSGLIWMAVVGLVSLAWSGAKSDLGDIVNAIRAAK